MLIHIEKRTITKSNLYHLTHPQKIRRKVTKMVQFNKHHCIKPYEGNDPDEFPWSFSEPLKKKCATEFSEMYDEKDIITSLILEGVLDEDRGDIFDCLDECTNVYFSTKIDAMLFVHRLNKFLKNKISSQEENSAIQEAIESSQKGRRID